MMNYACPYCCLCSCLFAANTSDCEFDAAFCTAAARLTNSFPRKPSDPPPLPLACQARPPPLRPRRSQGRDRTAARLLASCPQLDAHLALVTKTVTGSCQPEYDCRYNKRRCYGYGHDCYDEDEDEEDSEDGPHTMDEASGGGRGKARWAGRGLTRGSLRARPSGSHAAGVGAKIRGGQRRCAVAPRLCLPAIAAGRGVRRSGLAATRR
jgi:hypothetical protein